MREKLVVVQFEMKLSLRVPVRSSIVGHADEKPSAELEELGNKLKPLAEKYLYADEAAIFFLADRDEAKIKPQIHETSENEHPKRAGRVESSSGQPNGGRQRSSRVSRSGSAA